VFGQVTSNLPAYMSARHLARIARFRPGDPYRFSEMDDLREGILATSLVSTTTVKAREARAPAPGAPGIVDVDVTLAKAPQRTIAGLLGYSSGEGVRVEASWENRNFFPPEGMIKFRGVIGTREQLAGFTFRRSNFHERDQILTADLFAQTINDPAYKASTVSATASLEKQSTLIFQKPWTYSVGVQLVGTRDRRRTPPRAKPISSPRCPCAGPMTAATTCSIRRRAGACRCGFRPKSRPATGSARRM
jgi:translocation and assembly module TamA